MTVGQKPSFKSLYKTRGPTMRLNLIIIYRYRRNPLPEVETASALFDFDYNDLKIYFGVRFHGEK